MIDATNLQCQITPHVKTYGITLNSIFGSTNIDGEEKHLRLLHVGTITLAAGAVTTPSSVVVNITATPYIPVITLQDIDTTAPTTGLELCHWANLNGHTDARGWYDQIIIRNASLSTRFVLVRVWGFV